MSGISWFLVVGISGWLAGKMIGGKAYGENLAGYSADGLDIVFGIVGASIAGYLYSGAVSGEASSFIGYTAAILGSITLVWIARRMSTRYLPSNVH